jgi:GH25 family lysozyme M1 (1,4-beta-N-acetylmuramidase)
MSPDIRMSDISEWQPSFDAGAYLAGGCTCIIVRAHSGYRPDATMPGRRDQVRGFPFDAVGYYQYLAHDRDAATQARELLDVVGPLRGNEFLILDCEEGSGNQIPRADAWFAVVDPAQGFPATLYAGESFGNSNLGGWNRWSSRPRWIAAYRATEPTEPHDLWQNTDAAYFPGLSGAVDGNLFHGTGREFAARMRPGTPTPPSGDEIMAITAAVAKNGNLHVFVERGDGDGAWGKGSIWFTWQAANSTAWAGGAPGKQIAGLSPFAPAPK